MTAAVLGAMRVQEVVRAARERGASDIHIASHSGIVLRIDGQLVRRGDDVIDAEALEAFLKTQLDERAQDRLAERGHCDIASRGADLGALRLHVFRASDGLRCAIRLFPSTAPRIEEFDLPACVEQFALRKAGLILVVGPTGSGKTTLLASMIDTLNRSHPRHVVTLEDPIEYAHRDDRCVIAQCEIGAGSTDLSEAIQSILRADPDVIVIGELRDPEAMRSALGAAETGHLVLASLHTVDAPGALERLIDAFPVDGREQIRIQVAQTLAAVMALRLVPRARAKGRRAAAEILVATDAVRNLIREGKTHQLRSLMQTGRASGMQTLEMHLVTLVERGEITAQAALAAAQHPADLTQVRQP
ncbi:MAG TPA: PilT/PilU family type 4a pilus ATPase [Candidatus Acidoferrales bacterium]|nr:PilT/PilU family type 4a pilus ATPase [Candidatus Acidoferrales bacterium]